MTYRVIKYFTDLQDNGYPYNVGDIFPHEGKEVKPSRIAELASDNNRRKMPLIELVKDDSKDAPVTDDSTDAKANEAETVAEKPKKATTKRKTKSE